MDTLPIELLHVIASCGSDVYFGLLGYKFFTDTLTISKRVDYMILFGHSVEITSTMIYWYLNNKAHRINGPAIELMDGTKHWYQKGILHREDGPAIEWAIGVKQWYYKGQRHREDGPAVEYSDGTKQWYLNGNLIKEELGPLETIDN